MAQREVTASGKRGSHVALHDTETQLQTGWLQCSDVFTARDGNIIGIYPSSRM
jgi:hypothetical protein